MSLPYWPDDPLTPPGVHRLLLEKVATSGSDPYAGACSCGGWLNPRAWHYSAQAEAFDEHMLGVQVALRSAEAGQ